MTYAVSKIGDLTLIAVQKPFKSEIFDASVSYRVGSVFEKKEHAGISHAVEHCVFLGTKNLKTRKDVEEKLLSFGGDYNAFTGYEQTSYILSGQLPDLKEGISTLYEISSNATFEPGEDFEMEKGVVLSELEQDLDDEGNWQISSAVSAEHLFKGTPLEWGPIGFHQSVSALTPDTLRSYHQTHYRPERSCLTVVSSAKPADTIRIMEDSVQSYLKAIPSVVPIDVTFDSICAERKVLPVKAVSQSLEIDFFLPFEKPTSEVYDASLNMLSGILFHSELSLLFGETRKQGLAYAVTGGASTMLGQHVFHVTAMLNEEHVPEFCKLLQTQIKKMEDGDVSIPFTEMVMKNRKYRTDRAREQATYYAGLLEDLHFLKRDNILPEDLWKQYNRVRLADVSELANRVFRTPKACVTVKGPHSDETRQNLQEVLDSLLQ